MKPYHQRPFLELTGKTAKFSQKRRITFSTIHRPAGGCHERNCVLSLAYNSTTPLSEVFVLGFKFTNRQLQRKTFEVDKWASLEFPTRQ